MTVSCADCSKCGKCYPKKRPCPSCGATVDYGDDTACPTCGEPITAEMIEAAMAEYREQKRRELEQFFGAREFYRPRSAKGAASSRDPSASTAPSVRVIRVG